MRIVSTTQDAVTAATADTDRAPVLGARPRSPVELTAGLLRGRWTAPIIWHLFWGGKSFYQLLRELEGVSRQALARDLEEMEKNGLLVRTFQRSGPARVEYALTSLGESLKPVVGVMYEWGLKARDSASEAPDVLPQ